MGLFDEEMEQERARQQAAREELARKERRADEQALRNEAEAQRLLKEFVETMTRRRVPVSRWIEWERVRVRRGLLGQRIEYEDRETDSVEGWVVSEPVQGDKDHSSQDGYMVGKSGTVYVGRSGSYRRLSYHPSSETPDSDQVVQFVRDLLVGFARRQAG